MQKVYPCGSLLFLDAGSVSNLGIVGPKNIESTLASPDRKEISEDIKKMASEIQHCIMEQKAASSYACTADVVMTLEVLDASGVVGTAAGMTIVAAPGISVAVPECAGKP